MYLRICLAFLPIILIVQTAHAEGFKCNLSHVTTVGVNSSYEDELNANANVEFFLAIDDKTGGGTSSACTNSGCDNADILVLKRDGGDINNFRTIVLVSTLDMQLWTLEGFGERGKYRAVAVSINGGLSQSRFGECTKMSQPATTAALERHH